ERYWVFFKDKTGITNGSINVAVYSGRKILSERSIERRKKVLGDYPVQVSDLPVSTEYLTRLKEMGFKPVVLSKWLNAGSFHLSASEIRELNNLNFIKKIQPVARHIKRKPAKINMSSGGYLEKSNTDADSYGHSYNQNNLINTVSLHNAGITGKGILIGVLDTGFNLEHESLENVNVVAEYDFINRDFETMNEPGQDIYSQDSHGTAVLSAVGGYYSGQLIGSAFGADFALAKTEDNSGEFAVEEDYWVAGIEWLDSLGADVVTTSLGYNIFSDKEYARADMDGNTAVSTIAAALAVEKGIVVVNSAGNEGNNSWGIITAPADADGVIAVGAVNASGTIANFSSRGPTADGRIKPDVVAKGVSVYSAYSGFHSLYSYPDGTSMATPLVAGSAALILSAHPELTPGEVMTALKATADRSGTPDNTYGWGLIDAFAAATYYGPVFNNTPEVEEIPGGLELTVDILTDAGIDNNNICIYYCIGNSQNFNKQTFQNSQGTEYTAVIPLSGIEENIWFFFAAKDNTGKTTYYPGRNKASSFRYNTLDDELVLPMRKDRDMESVLPENVTLHQNFPNPFGNNTRINVELMEPAEFKLTVFNILGQKVRSLFSGELPPGSFPFTWNGMNESGIPVGSGVYFCRMTSQNYSKTIKMVLVNIR
ncbi:MAG: S8 family serine peptidase, partial [bacterium]|nr:S8 family serine peptidase [bacterium]